MCVCLCVMREKYRKVPEIYFFWMSYIPIVLGVPQNSKSGTWAPALATLARKCRGGGRRGRIAQRKWLRENTRKDTRTRSPDQEEDDLELADRWPPRCGSPRIHRSKAETKWPSEQSQGQRITPWRQIYGISRARSWKVAEHYDGYSLQIHIFQWRSDLAWFPD